MKDLQIKIGDGAWRDAYTYYGMVWVEGDYRFSAPERECDKSEYVEEDGEHIDERTTKMGFDYSCKVLIESRHTSGGMVLRNVNEQIRRYNTDIREAVEGGVVRKKEIGIWNKRLGVKIVGYGELIEEAEELYRSAKYGVLDFAVVELRLRVSDPNKCEF